MHGLSGAPGLAASLPGVDGKIHHSAIDGMALAGIIDALHRPDSEAGGARAEERAPASGSCGAGQASTV